MNLLFYNDCIGLNKPDRLYHVSAGDINPATGKAYAINPSSGVWDDNYFANNFGNNPQYMTFDEMANKQRDLAMKAIQPAVTSLQAGIPEIQAQYTQAQNQAEATRDPLLQRYQNLIDDINSTTQGQVTDTTKATNQEMARRGISADSGFAVNQLLGRTQPIIQAGSNSIRDTSLDRENKIQDLNNTIASLTTQETAAERDLRNSIANLQANAGTGAVTNALQQYQIAQQARQAALTAAIQARQVAVQEATAAQPNIQSVQGGLYDTTNNKWIVAPKASSDSSGISINTGAITGATGGTGATGTTNTPKDPLSLIDLSNLSNAGNSISSYSPPSSGQLTFNTPGSNIPPISNTQINPTNVSSATVQKKLNTLYSL